MDQTFQIKTPWYKTKGGKTFLIIIGLLFVIGLLFSLLVGYYIWQVASGKEVIINSPFSTTLSATDLQKEAPSFSENEIQKIIRTDNPTRGERTAPITIVAFIDFECPFSRAAFSPLEEAILQYNEAIYFVFKHLPLQAIHPQANATAVASQCANNQNKFWEYYQTIFTTQDLTTAGLQTAGTQNNLSVVAWSSCQDNTQTQTIINQDIKDATTLGVRGTPTFFVNGKRIEGSRTTAEWSTIILNALQQ